VLRNGQILRCHFAIKKRFIIGWLIDPVFRNSLLRNFLKSGEKLKKYCEKEFKKL